MRLHSLAVRGQQLFKVVKMGNSSFRQLKRQALAAKRLVAIGIIIPAIGGEFDYQGWQVFIIVKITLLG